MRTALQKSCVCALILALISFMIPTLAFAEPSDGVPTGVDSTAPESPEAGEGEQPAAGPEEPGSASPATPEPPGTPAGPASPETPAGSDPSAGAGLDRPAASDPSELDPSDNPADTELISTAAAPAQTLANGTYYLRPASSLTRMLDVSGASKNSGANVQLYQSNKTVAQQFTVEYNTKTGYYTLYTGTTNRQTALDVAGAGKKNGTNIQQYRVNNTLAQSWFIVKDNARADTYKLVSALSSEQSLTTGTGRLVADIAGAQDANGTNVQLYTENNTAAQSFYFINIEGNNHISTRVEGLDAPVVINAKVGSNMVVDVPGATDAASTQMHIYTKNNTVAQTFMLVWHDFVSKTEMLQAQAAGTTGTGYYTITSVCSGHVLDVRGGAIIAGTPVQQYSSNGTQAQRWTVERNGDGTYSIYSLSSGLALDVQGAGTANGTKLHLYRPNGTAAQKFTFTPASTSFLPSNNRAIIALTPRADTAKRLDIAGGSVAEGANVQAYNSNNTFAQRFELILAGDGHYALRAANSGRYLKDAGASASPRNNVVQGSIGPGVTTQAAELWDITLALGGCALKNVATNNYLTLTGTNLITQAASNPAAAAATPASLPFAQVFRINTATLVLESYYNIITPANNALEVTGGSRDNGARIRLNTAGDANAQKWLCAAQGGNTYTFVNPTSVKAIDLAGGTDSVGVAVQQYSRNNTNAQKFTLEPTGDGWFLLKTVSGNALSASSDAAGTNLVVGAASVGTKFRFRTTSYSAAISGDTELDNILRSIQNNIGYDNDALRRAYRYVVNNYRYRTGSTWPVGSWQTWSVPYAKEMYQMGSGNCYRYASLFCWLARAYGYDAYTVSGRNSSGGPHSWCYVYYDNAWRICDPDAEYELHVNAYMIQGGYWFG